VLGDLCHHAEFGLAPIHDDNIILYSLSTRASGDRAALNVAYAPGAPTRRDERAPTTNVMINTKVLVVFNIGLHRVK